MGDAERLIYNNELSKGLDLLNNLLYDEPGYGSLHNHIGWAYMYYTAEAERAELHFKMAIRFDPGFAPPYLHMGNLCLRTGRYTEAVDYLVMGREQAGANRFAFYESLGQAFEMQKEYSKAIDVFKEALLTSVAEHEMNSFRAGIKRCRKKRLSFLFTF